MSFVKTTCLIGVAALMLPSLVAAQYQGSSYKMMPPPGSYTQTCNSFTADRYTYPAREVLRALCKPKNLNINRFSRLDFTFCVGDISNEDGILRCTIDEAAKALQDAAIANDKASKMAAAEKIVQARPMFNSAVVLILGRSAPLFGENYASAEEMSSWLNDMNNPPYNMREQTADGVSLLEATQFLRARIRKEGYAPERAELIGEAFNEVYGREPTPIEQATYDARVKSGSDYYVTIVNAERAKSGPGTPGRTDAVTNMYKRTMGRNPTSVDLAYWLPRSDVYRSMVNASRNWLYSTNGAPDLVATIGRILVGANKAASDKNIKAVLIEVTEARAVYEEMPAIVSLMQGLDPA